MIHLQVGTLHDFGTTGDGAISAETIFAPVKHTLEHACLFQNGAKNLDLRCVLLPAREVCSRSMLHF